MGVDYDLVSATILKEKERISRALCRMVRYAEVDSFPRGLRLYGAGVFNLGNLASSWGAPRGWNSDLIRDALSERSKRGGPTPRYTLWVSRGTEVEMVTVHPSRRGGGEHLPGGGSAVSRGRTRSRARRPRQPPPSSRGSSVPVSRLFGPRSPTGEHPMIPRGLSVNAAA